MCFGLKAQDYTIFYSQIIKSPEYFNPSFGAHKDDLSAKLIFNNKYNGYKDNPKSCAFVISIPIMKSTLGTGINVLKEDIGLRQIISINGILNSCVRISNSSFISAGIQLGIRKLGYDETKLKTYNNLDISKIEMQSTKTTFGFGFYFNDLYNFIGIASSDIALDKVHLIENIDIYAGRNIALSDIFILKPAFLYKNFYGDELYHIKSEIYYNNSFGLGVYCTINRDYGFNTEIKLVDRLWMGYLFEIEYASQKMKLTSHSISISYNVGLLNALFKKINRFNRSGLLN